MNPDVETGPDDNEQLTVLVADYLEQRNSAEEYDEKIRNNEGLKEKALERCISLRDELSKHGIFDGKITVVVGNYAVTLTREEGEAENKIIISPVLVAK